MYAYEIIYENKFGFLGISKIKFYKGEYNSKETSTYYSESHKYSDIYYTLDTKKGKKKFKKIYALKSDMYFDILYELDKEEDFFDENIKNWKNKLYISEETLSDLEKEIRIYFDINISSIRSSINIKSFFTGFAEAFRSIDNSSDAYDQYCEYLQKFGRKYSEKYYR